MRIINPISIEDFRQKYYKLGIETSRHETNVEVECSSDLWKELVDETINTPNPFIAESNYNSENFKTVYLHEYGNVSRIK
jgi:hypothetical protein